MEMANVGGFSASAGDRVYELGWVIFDSAKNGRSDNFPFNSKIDKSQC
jgi:hypothetical protein